MNRFTETLIYHYCHLMFLQNKLFTHQVIIKNTHTNLLEKILVAINFLILWNVIHKMKPLLFKNITNVYKYLNTKSKTEIIKLKLRLIL